MEPRGKRAKGKGRQPHCSGTATHTVTCGACGGERQNPGPVPCGNEGLAAGNECLAASQGQGHGQGKGQQRAASDAEKGSGLTHGGLR